MAILEGFQHGILTSTSLMVNMSGFEHAVSLMKQYPDLLHVGIHLVTKYSVVKGLKTLTDENDHRCNIYIHKVKNTPIQYPRDFSRIKKKPL